MATCTYARSNNKEPLPENIQIPPTQRNTSAAEAIPADTVPSDRDDRWRKSDFELSTVQLKLVDG